MTPAFAELLVLYEKQETAMRLHFPEMVAAIDLRKEAKRLDQIEFATQRAARTIRVTPAERNKVELSPAEKALADVGVPVQILDPETLAAGNLSLFDAIVIGPRAYEVEPVLGRANPSLIDCARDGGLVLIQYQQYQYTTGGYAPYPLEIARPHGRVTDEAAPVKVLEPASPAFTTPNAIGEGDWESWVQERGLYMPATWGEPFRPLLEMPDEDGRTQRGGLLVAPVGEGTYVYTGLAFFRQLPAGVPGAYRLFANLLAAGRTAGEAETAGPAR